MQVGDTIDDDDIPVIEGNPALKTNAKGEIELSKIDTNTVSEVTGKPLKYGLPIGTYYFKEIEAGASDSYELREPIVFEIVSANNETGAAIEWSTGNADGTVTNTPTEGKTLQLTKVDEKENTPLQNAEFILTYVSITDGQSGSATGNGQSSVEISCYTDQDGILRVQKGDTKAASDPSPDISKKGTYKLTEVKAPDGYATITDASGNPITILTFTVNSANEIVEVTAADQSKNWISVGPAITTDKDNNNKQTGISLTLKNAKTVVSINKTIDKVDGDELSGAKLEIYEGIGTSGSLVVTIDETNTTGKEEIAAGTLKEDTIYTLHESKVPIGYLKAEDMYFYLHGTIAADSTEAQIYVWEGSGKPEKLPNNLTGSASGSWDRAGSKKNNETLVMVDETAIAPVNLKKVSFDGKTRSALSNVIFDVYDLDIEGENQKIGTVVTGTDGFLTWKTIETIGTGDQAKYGNDHIYTAAGNKVTSEMPTEVVLQKNTNGYRFTESAVPDNIYYDSAISYVVKITDDNYAAFRDEKRSTEYFINLKELGENASAATLTKKSDLSSNPEDKVVDNDVFETTLVLFKYDAEHEKINAASNNFDMIGIDGVEFTLSDSEGKQVGEPIKTTTLTIGETVYHGYLAVPILKKGTYTLTETKAAAGYKLDDKNPVTITFTVDNEDHKKIITYDSETESGKKKYVVKSGDESESAAEKEEEITISDVYKVANERIHGTVTLKKIDKDTKEELQEVTYKLTRISPTDNAQDEWFTAVADESHVNSIEVQTGYTYKGIYKAESLNDILASRSENKDSKGTLTLEDLQWGKYQLEEIQSLDGYKLSTKVYEFEIGPDKQTESYNAENEKTQVKLVKTDMNSEKLIGAKFKLYQLSSSEGENGTVYTKDTNTKLFYKTAAETDSAKRTNELTIESKDEISIYGLKEGTYLVEETEAPKGYELTDPILITIDKYGRITEAGSCEVSEDNTTVVKKTSGYQAVYDQEENTVSVTGSAQMYGLTYSEDQVPKVTVKNKPIEVSLKKLDMGNAGKEVDTTKMKIVIKPAKGSAFSDGAESITAGSADFAARLYGKLIAGNTYTLEETAAPAGYHTAPEIVTFTVDTDGKITIAGDNAAKAEKFISVESLEDTQGHYTVEQLVLRDVVQNNLKLIKTDIKNEANKLSGVTFELVPAVGSAFSENFLGEESDTVKFEKTGDSITKVTLTTNAEGEVSFPDGLFLYGQSYVLTEVALGTNNTYRKAASKENRQITFTIDENNGKIKNLQEGTNNLYSLSSDGSNLTVKNVPIELSISKWDMHDATKTVIVTFELSKLENGTFVKVDEWKSDGTAHIKRDLTPGEYELKETKAEGGYSLAKGALYFTIEENGSVTPKKIGDTAVDEESKEVTNQEDGSQTINIKGSNYKVTNPKDGSAGEVSIDVYNTRFTNLEVTKIGETEAEKLAGVTFTLQVKGADGVFRYVELENQKAKLTSSGTEQVLAVTDDKSMASVTTNENGVILIEELLNGEYKLTEIQTIRGYQLLSSPITIVIDRNGESYWKSGDQKTKTVVAIGADDKFAITVQNKKGFTLPATGENIPKLPIPLLILIAVLEILTLWGYAHKKKGVKGKTK